MTAISGSTCRSATASCSPMRGVNWLYQTEPEPELDGRQHHPAARQGAGRLELDQRAALRPRAGRGLRPLAPARQCRLELRRRAAVFPQGRGSGSAAPTTCTAPAGRSPSPTCEPHPLCEAFIEAAEQAGFPAQRRFQRRRSQEGAGYYQFTARNGRRCSTARGYLKPARRRANLAVVSGALAIAHAVRRHAARSASNIVKDGADATRARERRSDPVAAARSTRRSCCSFPASGRPICCARHGIEVVADMPGVGDDLQDHYPVALQLPLHASRSRSTT